MYAIVGLAERMGAAYSGVEAVLRQSTSEGDGVGDGAETTNVKHHVQSQTMAAQMEAMKVAGEGDADDALLADDPATAATPVPQRVSKKPPRSRRRPRLQPATTPAAAPITDKTFRQPAAISPQVVGGRHIPDRGGGAGPVGGDRQGHHIAPACTRAQEFDFVCLAGFHVSFMCY